MKAIDIDDADLKVCVRSAREEGVVITRKGKPIVVLVPVDGMDMEQVELSYSDRFWKLISQRRGQKTISRQELERRLNGRAKVKNK